MHPKDDLLLAYRDNQLPEAQASLLREHLAHCAACQQRLEQVTDQAAMLQARLGMMTPGPLEQPRSPQAAYHLFTNKRMKMQEKENQSMFRKRTLWIAISVVALLAIVFTLTPANALASSFLSLFRVQKVQVITFDTAAAETARGKVEANQAAIENIFKEDLKITRQGKNVEVASVDEAAQKAGFTPHLPTALENPIIRVEPGMNAIFTIHNAKLQALIDAVGVDAKLPAAVDGKPITVDVAAAVVVSSGCQTTQNPTTKENMYIASTCTSFVQMPSPVVNTPEGLNIPALGQAVFQFMGLPADQAAQLSQKIDWTSTLVLPIPTDNKVTYKDVQVDGVSGTLLEGSGQDGSALVWVKDGMLYGLHVPGTGDDAMKIAATIK